MRKPEIRGHDADHDVIMRVESDGLSDYCRICAEAAPPQALAENHYRAAGALIAGTESAAENRLGRNMRELLGNDAQTDYQIRNAVTGQRKWRFPARQQRFCAMRTGAAQQSRWRNAA